MTSAEVERHAALADFLRTRRARLTPGAVGLPAGARRRTPGLRREEVALLANIGTAWYTALEQGRNVHPSAGVLESLAAALRLTPDEKRHLFLLAGQSLAVQPSSYADEEMMSPVVRRLIDGLDPAPAYVLGRRWDYLYWNRAAALVWTLTDAPPPHPRNFVWRLFVDPSARRAGWAEVARTTLAQFRADSALYRDDPHFAALIDDLQRESPEFRDWWPLHDVRGSLDARKELRHPVLGDLVLDRLTLHVPGVPGLKLIVYTPSPETDTAVKLRRALEMPTPVVSSVAVSHPSLDKANGRAGAAPPRTAARPRRAR